MSDQIVLRIMSKAGMPILSSLISTIGRSRVEISSKESLAALKQEVKSYS
jgi:hypothetical protein